MSDFPKAVWSGSFNLFGVEIRCHVLEDGQRIIEADSVAAFIAALEEIPDSQESHDPSEVVYFTAWLKGR